MSGFGCGVKNEGGENILDFATSYALFIRNIYLKKIDCLFKVKY